MTNRKILGISSKFVAQALVENFDEAVGTFGKDLLEGLTGYGLSKLEKMAGLPESITRLEELIRVKIELLEDEGFLTEDGLSEKGLDVIALNTLIEELEILGKLGHGEHLAKRKGIGIYPLDVKPYRHEGYHNLSIRRTIHTALKRGHQEIQKEDLKAWEKAKSVGIDFVYALDTSGSMRGEKIGACKRAAIGLAYLSLKAGDGVAVVGFGKKASTVINFGEPLEIFSKKVVSLTPGSMTDIALGIRTSRDCFPDDRKEKHIILITDALPTEGKRPVEEALEEASVTSSLGITLSVVGIGLNKEGNDTARRLAAIGKGNFYAITNPEKINEVILEERYKLKEKYIIS